MKVGAELLRWLFLFSSLPVISPALSWRVSRRFLLVRTAAKSRLPFRPSSSAAPLLLPAPPLLTHLILLSSHRLSNSDPLAPSHVSSLLLSLSQHLLVVVSSVLLLLRFALLSHPSSLLLSLAMFYSRELLSRRGPLGTIWLAGSYLRRLDKRSILASNLVRMCAEVENPPVPLALPTQSTLLLGVVNIEQRKSKYLLGHLTPHPYPPQQSTARPAPLGHLFSPLFPCLTL